MPHRRACARTNSPAQLRHTRTPTGRTASGPQHAIPSGARVLLKLLRGRGESDRPRFLPSRQVRERPTVNMPPPPPPHRPPTAFRPENLPSSRHGSQPARWHPSRGAEESYALLTPSTEISPRGPHLEDDDDHLPRDALPFSTIRRQPLASRNTSSTPSHRDFAPVTRVIPRGPERDVVLPGAA